jgi:serine/threonine protein kinase
MHERGVVHRDLKPENIMLESPNDINDLKIIDFGTSRQFDNKDQMIMTEKIGTLGYLAPEVIEACRYEDGVSKSTYNEKCDLFSIGVITFLLLTGKLLIDDKGDDQQKYMKEATKNFYRDKTYLEDEKFLALDEKAKSFIGKMFEREKDRPTAKEALEHDFIKNASGIMVKKITTNLEL